MPAFSALTYESLVPACAWMEWPLIMKTTDDRGSREEIKVFIQSFVATDLGC
jgi:hypothetical protein